MIGRGQRRNLLGELRQRLVGAGTDPRRHRHVVRGVQLHLHRPERLGLHTDRLAGQAATGLDPYHKLVDALAKLHRQLPGVLVEVRDDSQVLAVQVEPALAPLDADDQAGRHVGDCATGSRDRRWPLPLTRHRTAISRTKLRRRATVHCRNVKRGIGRQPVGEAGWKPIPGNSASVEVPYHPISRYHYPILKNSTNNLGAGTIARFHNVYGPHGTWDGGREGPAAICRKVIEAKAEHRLHRNLGRRHADPQLHVY